jgi:RpiB/LacA/LacB family sugar-phosphate isomerase
VPSEAEIRSMVERILDRMEATAPDAVGQATADPAARGDSGEDGGRPTRVAVGADHGGFRLKEYLAFRLKERGLEVTDCGTHSEESVDYPDLALAVAQLVADGNCDVGIVVDGAGIGSSMVANKVPGVRAALCYDVSSARNSREHNHANVLTLGAGLIGQGLAWQIVEAWLDTPWGSGRHARRVAMIDAIDDGYRGRTG